jgi:hypothetical protein
MARDETFEDFSKWWLKKYPNATGEDLISIFEARKSWRENQRFIIKQELIRYGLIDENGIRPGLSIRRVRSLMARHRSHK